LEEVFTSILTNGQTKSCTSTKTEGTGDTYVKKNLAGSSIPANSGVADVISRR